MIKKTKWNEIYRGKKIKKLTRISLDSKGYSSMDSQTWSSVCWVCIANGWTRLHTKERRGRERKRVRSVDCMGFAGVSYLVDIATTRC